MNYNELCEWVNHSISKKINKELKSKGEDEGFDNSSLFYMIGALVGRVEELEEQIKKLEESIVDVEDSKKGEFYGRL